MKWTDVLKDKSLQDLPYKVELNARGQIVMSPATNRHGMFQSRISVLLNRIMKSGFVISECSIDTLDGVKVADVAWASEQFIQKHEYQTPYAQAPDICVEITSPSNSEDEIQQKITLYLAKGAKEVWVCDEAGNVIFNDHLGEIRKSKIAPRFPSKMMSGSGSCPMEKGAKGDAAKRNVNQKAEPKGVMASVVPSPASSK